MSAKNWRAKLVLLGVMVLFALPILVATGLYHLAPEWRSWGTSNRGSLIVPLRDVGISRLKANDGQSLALLNGKWTIVVIGNGCDDYCRKLLHLTKQIQISLGREANRVARLYVANNAATLPSARDLLADNPSLRFASAPHEWFEQFSVGNNDPVSAGHVYIIDPHGYLMMEYSREKEGNDIRKDLLRLLKASKGS